MERHDPSFDHLYKNARWRRLRREIWVRDNYICQRSGTLCNEKRGPYSPIANHRIPHKGDEVLFWDPANIETVAKFIHDGLVQREERRSQVIGTSPDGEPLDPDHPWRTHERKTRQTG